MGLGWLLLVEEWGVKAMRKPQWFRDGKKSGMVTLRVALTRDEIECFEKYAKLREFSCEAHAWDYVVSNGITDLVNGYDEPQD